MSSDMQLPFRPEHPVFDVVELATTIIREELPGFEMTGAFASFKPNDLLPSLSPLALVVMSTTAEDVLQVLAREDPADGWTAISVDTVPTWIALDRELGVATRVTVVEQGALEVRCASKSEVYDIPVLNGRLCLVEWGADNKPHSTWPEPVAIRRADGWHDPVLPGLYMSEQGLVDSFPLTDEPTPRELTASIYLDATIVHDPRRALKLIRLLIARADDDQLGLIGAGPLEELVIMHGDRLLDEVRRLATIDKQFRRALEAAWIYRASKRVRSELTEFYPK
jgi:hypothetical protein